MPKNKITQGIDVVKNKVTEGTDINKETYAPDMRTFLEPAPNDLVSGEGKVKTTLPSHTHDPIVCNNIASQEFDYTDNLIESDKL